MNQSPCVHISGQWKASSTRYRPPWWPLGGWASPKVLNWKTTTLLTQNYIWIISSVDQQYRVISRAHKHMPKCQQKNCSTGAIKSLNPLTMISTCFIWAGLICPLFLLSQALQSVRKALFTQRLHIIAATKAHLHTACSLTGKPKRHDSTHHDPDIHVFFCCFF